MLILIHRGINICIFMSIVRVPLLSVSGGVEYGLLLMEAEEEGPQG